MVKIKQIKRCHGLEKPVVDMRGQSICAAVDNAFFNQLHFKEL